MHILVRDPEQASSQIHLGQYSNLVLGDAYELGSNSAVSTGNGLFGQTEMPLSQLVADALAFMDFSPDFFDTEEKGMLTRAVHIFSRVNHDQRRKSGDWAGDHARCVAQELYQAKFDPEVVIAGLLHDVPEDFHDPSIATICRYFSERVGFLVEAVTRDYGSEILVYYNQIALAAEAEPAVVFIKLFDNMSNLKTVLEVDDIDWRKRWIEKMINLSEHTYERVRPIIAVKAADRLALFDQVREENLAKAREIKRFLAAIQPKLPV